VVDVPHEHPIAVAGCEPRRGLGGAGWGPAEADVRNGDPAAPADVNPTLILGDVERAEEDERDQQHGSQTAAAVAAARGVVERAPAGGFAP